MGGVSTLANLTAQLTRFETLNSQFADLQRSLASNKKTTTFQGLGGDGALSTLRYRTTLQANEQYTKNLGIAQTRMKTMSGALDMIQGQVRILDKGLSQQPVEGTTDLSSIRTYATKLLEIMPGNINEEINGRYVFAGADFTTQPYEGNAKLAQLVDQDFANWKDGTITTTEFLARIEGYTNDEIGFSAEVINAGRVTTRATDTLELDYTVKANNESFKKVLVSAEILSRLDFPAETDAPGELEFHRVLKAMSSKLTEGSKALEKDNVSIQAAMVSVDEVQKQHKFDANALKDLISDIEDTDTTEVAVKLQNIQLQLQASYQVTAALAGLNLVNYLSN